VDVRPERAGIHLVPQESRAETERTLAATPGVRGEPSDAERSRTLLAGVRTHTDDRCCCSATWPNTAAT
jgi:hypothetical protein